MDCLACPVAKACKVRRENRVLDRLGHQARLDQEEMSEELELEVRRVPLDHKDCVVLVEPMDCQDLQDRMVQQELLDPKDHEVITVSVVNKVILVPLAQLAELVPEARLDSQDHLEQLDQLDHLVQSVRKASRDRVGRLALLVHPVTLDQLDPQVLQDLAVLLETLDPWDLMAQ